MESDKDKPAKYPPPLLKEGADGPHHYTLGWRVDEKIIQALIAALEIHKPRDYQSQLQEVITKLEHTSGYYHMWRESLRSVEDTAKTDTEDETSPAFMIAICTTTAPYFYRRATVGQFMTLTEYMAGATGGSGLPEWISTRPKEVLYSIVWETRRWHPCPDCKKYVSSSGLARSVGLFKRFPQTARSPYYQSRYR